MRSEFSGAAVLVVLSGAAPAVAADLAVRPPLERPSAAPPSHVPEWAGFYFGIHGGAGWDRAAFEADVSPSTAIPGVTARGGVFGGHAGYNWQYGPYIGGIEADFDGADIKAAPAFVPLGIAGGPAIPLTREYKFDELASFRGRLGYGLLHNLLVYGTAGIGWGHAHLTVTDPLTGLADSVFSNRFGWVAGAGLEYRLFEHLVLRAEYLHYDFGRGAVSGSLASLGAGINIRDRVDVIRGGVSYKF